MPTSEPSSSETPPRAETAPAIRTVKGNPVLWALGLGLLAGTGILMAAVLLNLRAMERSQLHSLQTLARSINESSMHSIFRGQSENMFNFVMLLSRIPNIQYVAYWSNGKRILEAGQSAGLAPGLLDSAVENTEGLRLPRHLYFGFSTPPPAGQTGPPTLLAVVFSLEAFIAQKNNILLATWLSGVVLAALGAALLLLNRLYRQLAAVHREVLEKNQVLNQTQERLRQEQNQKSAMLSAITHDANAYLTVIHGKLDNQLFKLRQGQPPENLEKNLAVTQQNAEALVGLIGDLGDHERLIQGRMPIHAEVVELGPLLEAVCDALEEEAAAKRQVLSVFSPAGCRVLADPAQLKRVLFNLVRNALKFSPAGTPVRLQAACSERSVTLQVQDQGPGIPEPEWERIFEPFVRLQPGVKGTGLGLAIARQLAQVMGGGLRVTDSAPGQGTTFSLTLPAGE
ncbi:MAG: HAMP domain-containing sensor histidine kinase [candidate division FCPU426 bacterium]